MKYILNVRLATVGLLLNLISIAPVFAAITDQDLQSQLTSISQEDALSSTKALINLLEKDAQIQSSGVSSYSEAQKRRIISLSIQAYGQAVKDSIGKKEKDFPTYIELLNNAEAFNSSVSPDLKFYSCELLGELHLRLADEGFDPNLNAKISGLHFYFFQRHLERSAPDQEETDKIRLLKSMSRQTDLILEKEKLRTSHVPLAKCEALQTEVDELKKQLAAKEAIIKKALDSALEIIKDAEEKHHAAAAARSSARVVITIDPPVAAMPAVSSSQAFQ